VTAELVAALGEGVVVTDPVVTDKYRFDRSADPTVGRPLAVVRAESVEDVQAAVRWAGAHRVPVVTRGAGSGLAGGANAVDGGIVISLERMTAVSVDAAAGVAVVGAGALNVDVKAAAAAVGLWYPPDPSSYEICSNGGNIATNAGGLCCVKYGVTMEYVLGLEVVLADGTLVRLGGRQIKDKAGLSLVKMFVGSEGILGIVTSAILRLMPARCAPATLVATFPNLQSAADAVVAIRTTTRPSMLELMDAASINAVEDYRSMGLNRDAGALLLAQSDAPAAARADEIGVIADHCDRAGADEVFSTDEADEGDLFVAARRLTLPAIEARVWCCSKTSASPSPPCRG
jgi:glycolate oxidase